MDRKAKGIIRVRIWWTRCGYYYNFHFYEIRVALESDHFEEEAGINKKEGKTNRLKYTSAGSATNQPKKLPHPWKRGASSLKKGPDSFMRGAAPCCTALGKNNLHNPT